MLYEVITIDIFPVPDKPLVGPGKQCGQINLPRDPLDPICIGGMCDMCPFAVRRYAEKTAAIHLKKFKHLVERTLGVQSQIQAGGVASYNFV